MKFEELIKDEGLRMKSAPQNMRLEMGYFRDEDIREQSLVQENHISRQELEIADHVYRKALVNRDRIKQLLKAAEAVLEKAEEKVLEVTGKKQFDCEFFEIKPRCYGGQLSREKLKLLYPEVDLERVSNPKTIKLKINLKVKV